MKPMCLQDEAIPPATCASRLLLAIRLWKFTTEATLKSGRLNVQCVTGGFQQR